MRLEPGSAAALFSPQRLTQARQMLGVSRAELARRASLSAAAISQYESATTRPRGTTLAELALVLNVPLEFLTTSRTAAVPLPTVDTAFFRSLRRTTQKDRERAAAYAGLLAQLVAEIERRVTLPAYTPIDDLALDPDVEPEQAEQAARELRQRWELGGGPIANVVRLIERHGVIITSLALSDDVDAFSWAQGPRPLILLGTDKGNFERSRFNACHELAHITCHAADPAPAHPGMERQAHRFAGALLIPAEAMRDEWPRGRWDWSDLIRIKQTWGISINALLIRSRNLGLITPATYQNKIKYVSRMGWRTREPGPALDPELPDLLNQALGLLDANGITAEQIAEEGNLLGATPMLQALGLTLHPPLRVEL